LRDNTLPRQVVAEKPSISSTTSLNAKNTSLYDERRTQPANPELQLTRLNEKLADLEARLRSIEATTNERVKDQTALNPDEPSANEGSEKAKAKKLSESDLGHWMDAILDTGDFDRDATKLTLAQMGTSLAEVPGVNLADMQCGARFCRASFVADNGKSPNVSQLIGASPFIESGFTIKEPDGRVRVYFTQPGESLSDLRSEAQESALSDGHPQ